jgi:hypothetical protein
MKEYRVKSKPIRLVSVLLAGVFLLILACSLGPRPEIVGVSASENLSNLDYTVYVDCTVRNNGGDGDIEVSATLRNGGFWTKRESVFVAKNSERKVTLGFPEVEFLEAGLSGYQYNCSAR